MALSHAHLIKLRRSALSDGQIEALGWSSLPNGRLLIPYLRPDGRPETCHDGRPFCRERLSDADIAADPKGGKYRSPRGEGCRLFHSPLAIAAGGYAERLQDPYTPLRITEGEAKTVAASIHDRGRLTIGLGGVSAWRDRYDGQGHDAPSRPLVDWEEIPLLGREVRLCFDSDREKPQVAAALRALAEFLAERGAEVLVEVLPHGLDGERLGVDDLIDRHGPEVFLAIARIAKSPFKTSQVRGETQRRWAFDGQPSNTYERNVVLAGLMGPDWRRSPDGADHWLRWCGSHWQAVAGDDLLAADMERFMELQGWRNRELPVVNSLLAAFRRAIKPAPEISSQGTCAGLVPFCNGCLALDGLVLLPHSRHHGHRWSLPYAYDPEATCERARAFLLDRLGDTASVAVFRAFARALLIGERLKCFLEISGVSNTGKSVLANLLVALAGPQNTAAGKLNRLEDASQRFETLKLRGKRLAIFSECHDYSGQLQTLKAITGGDPIPAEVKGGRHLDFTFHGGVVLVGNGPIRASDASGAVINRRRSLPVNKVVAAAAERVMLEPDGSGGWRGELVAELPGLVNWALAMAPEEARAALARDVHSLARAEAELDTLLATDLLAEWAEASLVWSPQSHLRVGTADAPADGFLFSSYLRFIQQQGGNSRPLGLRTFKAKLVDLLRDTLSLPLPAGHPTAGAYRLRGVGSVVPGLAWRGTAEEAPGVIRQAFLDRIGAVAGETEAERDQRGSIAVGNGWNGWSGSGPLPAGEEPEATELEAVDSLREREAAEAVPCVPSIPQMESGPKESVPEATRSNPLTASEWVEVALEALRLAPHPAHLPAVLGWLEANPAAPAISKGQLANALERLHQEEELGEADQLQLGWHLPGAMGRGSVVASAPSAPVAPRSWPSRCSALQSNGDPQPGNRRNGTSRLSEEGVVAAGGSMAGPPAPAGCWSSHEGVEPEV